MAKILIDEPDVLILDEPTNHLDQDMINWLEDYLSQKNLTLLMVTHDRYFLERVCTDIVELDRGKLYTYSGNYSDYLLKNRVTKDSLLECLNRLGPAKESLLSGQTEKTFGLLARKVLDGYANGDSDSFSSYVKKRLIGQYYCLALLASHDHEQGGAAKNPPCA